MAGDMHAVLLQMQEVAEIHIMQAVAVVPTQEAWWVGTDWVTRIFLQEAGPRHGTWRRQAFRDILLPVEEGVVIHLLQPIGMLLLKDRGFREQISGMEITGETMADLE